MTFPVSFVDLGLVAVGVVSGNIVKAVAVMIETVVVYMKKKSGPAR